MVSSVRKRGGKSYSLACNILWRKVLLPEQLDMNGHQCDKIMAVQNHRSTDLIRINFAFYFCYNVIQSYGQYSILNYSSREELMLLRGWRFILFCHHNHSSTYSNCPPSRILPYNNSTTVLCICLCVVCVFGYHSIKIIFIGSQMPG